MLVTNSVADQVIKGNYDPSTYTSSTVISDVDEIVCGINSELNTDSLLSYLIKLGTFQNRNSGSDTVSSTTGIGAARRWAHSKFQDFSDSSENRLIPAYFQFDQVICGMNQHRNILAVLPGADTSDKSIIIIEGHIDSRCEDGCDITCQAHGIEDNGSGTALVMELARVMSKYTFKHTLVFMLTIAEEQGLYGANAFAQFSQNNGITIRAVQNNDVIGGIICGATSSPPSCPSENHIDSTSVRLFSLGGFNKIHRSYARSIKIFYDEKFKPIADVPMTIRVMNYEDRTGRGGDHMPFHDRGYTAVRFCSANEHGDAGVSDTSYTDRQHTTTDILGVDTDLDGEIDSFFVDFNYLKRNCLLNAITATLVSEGPETPTLSLVTNDTSGVVVQITGQTQYNEYRIAIRPSDSTTSFEAVYTVNDTLPYALPGMDSSTTYFVSVASVENGIMSIFSPEIIITNVKVNTSQATTTSFSNVCVCACQNATINIILESATDKSSCGTNDGDITIVASGGNPPLSYSINGGVTFTNTTGVFTGLPAGNYDIMIQDAFGCTRTGSTLTINDPSAIVITSEASTDATGCGINDGSIIIIASDTSGGILSYSIDGGSTFPNTTGIFGGLSKGTYYVVVRDTNLCSKIGSTIIIDDPSTVTGIISSTPDTGGVAVGTASISSVSGGNIPYTYSWSNGSNSSNATGLTTGTYTVTVTDASGCTYVDNVFVGTVTDVREFTDANVKINIYPNPNNGLFRIDIKALEAMEIDLKIVNLVGQEVYYERITVTKGVNQKTVDLSEYSVGVYNCSVLVDGVSVANSKLVVQ